MEVTACIVCNKTIEHPEKIHFIARLMDPRNRSDPFFLGLHAPCVKQISPLFASHFLPVRMNLIKEQLEQPTREEVELAIDAPPDNILVPAGAMGPVERN